MILDLLLQNQQKKEEIRSKMLELTQKRGPDSSICPSEVVRALYEDWRPLMDTVREVAAEEVENGTIRVTQKGRDVNVAEVKGTIRLSWSG